MDRLNTRLARIAEALGERTYPMPLKSARLLLEFADGRESVLPVAVGKLPDGFEPDRTKEKGESAKKKILTAAPEKHEKPVNMKKLLKAAGLSVSDWTRNKLWELVDEGELVSLRDGFRKAK